MVMRREIWISLITCNSTPFHPIDMGLSPDIIEFFAENYYQVFIISFLNFIPKTKFGHHIWRHNSSSHRMKKTSINRLFTNLLACQVSLHSMESTAVYGLEPLVLEGREGKALSTDHRASLFQAFSQLWCSAKTGERKNRREACWQT